ncbi:hypothetical protein NLX83_15460 [Allokutzneria sp. A3M-2-11 16]|uniref:hypothetical protein n=1 Tax=Allokutzneria sp. A3M-2-11 16 TaxID=2962043 RepID=UPI0020B80321|nr:hypothetical protein [Allokutzneria sp. A3M-2-11 16]MCP3800664.1 hypothetical protein [Allokutzneria sp. A3M-2-11 16]
MPTYPPVPEFHSNLKGVVIPERDPFRVLSFPPLRLVSPQQQRHLDLQLADAVRAGVPVEELVVMTKWPENAVTTALARAGIDPADPALRRDLVALVSAHLADLVWLNVETRARPVHEVCEDMGLTPLQMGLHYTNAQRHHGHRRVESKACLGLPLLWWPDHTDISTATLDIPSRDPFAMPDVGSSWRSTSDAEAMAFADAVVAAFTAGEPAQSISVRTRVSRDVIEDFLREAGIPPPWERRPLPGVLHLADLMLTERVTRAHLCEGLSVSVLCERYEMNAFDMITRLCGASTDVLTTLEQVR